MLSRLAGQGAPSVILPDGPRDPRIIQVWLWLKKPTWFLDQLMRRRCCFIAVMAGGRLMAPLPGAWMKA